MHSTEDHLFKTQHGKYSHLSRLDSLSKLPMELYSSTQAGQSSEACALRSENQVASDTVLCTQGMVSAVYHLLRPGLSQGWPT